MHLTKYFFLAALSSLVFLGCANKILAQSESSDQSKPVFETQAETLSKDIRQLKIQYRGELEEYRRLENQYQIAREQYEKLETLASLDDAVQKTKEVMRSRADVLHTYLRLLRLNLLSQTGIELPEKQAAEQDLLASLRVVEQHQQKLKTAVDKPQLAELTTEFEVLVEEVEEAAYRSLSVMAIGKLQTVHDKTLVLKSDMQEKLATAGGALRSAERRRSFDETDRVLAKLKTEFDLVEAQIIDPGSSSGFKGVYRALDDRLSSIHSSLSQVMSFLGELLKI